MLKHVEQEFLDHLTHLYDPQEIKELFIWCAEDTLHLSRSEVMTQNNRELNIDETNRFKTILTALAKGEPIQYSLGYAWFYGMKLKVNEAVLIPRPETEELVALIINEIKSGNVQAVNSQAYILDIGTGSGCIPVALKKKIPTAQVWTLDISTKALAIAQVNAKNEEASIHFIEGDILNSGILFPQQKFDIIVSNPPYIPPSEKSAMHENVLNYEPHLALFISEENPLLFYENIAIFAKEHLNSGGKLYFEINRRFGEELKQYLEKQGFREVNVHQDINGADRMISCRFVD